MAASETAKLIAQLGFDDKLTPGVNTALKSVGRLDKGLGRAGKGVGQLAGGMARAGTIIAGAAVTGLGAAAKAAIDWEDAFAGVVKTVDQADLAKAGLTFRDIELSLRKMSTTMPTSAADLAAIAESAGAMGVKGKDIVEFTRVVALLGSTTNIAVGDAATALGQMQNVIGLTADEFDNFAAALVDLGNKGNSTEAQILEIARRSGGAAKLIGVAKEATLGWAAAAANLGLNEELAGTAVQNFFLKTQRAITDGGAELKQLAKISGVTTKQFKKNFDKDASGALEDFLQGLARLPKDKRLTAISDIFGKGSGITRLLAGLTGDIDPLTGELRNLGTSLDTSAAAWEANTAAQVEFDKRNATVRSGISRLKNSLIDAAITLGEGFAPALGKSAAKLSEFLAQDANRSALKSIGEDIGKAIDGIDWGQVLQGARTFVTVMKSALSVAKLLLDAVMALPTEVKAAGLALIGLNKLSGGMVGAGVGNIVGGVAESAVRGLGSKLPGVGRLFAQPVFVTNWPVGGLGGGLPGAAGAGGWAGSLKGLGLALGPAVAAALVSSEVTSATNKGMGTNFLAPGTGGIGGGIITALHNLGEVIKLWKPEVKVKVDDRSLDSPTSHPKTPIPVRMVGDQPDRTDPAKIAWRNEKRDKAATAVENLRRDIGPNLSQTPVKLDIVKASVVEAGLAAKNAGTETKAAATAAGIASALAAKNAGINTQSTVRSSSSTNAAIISGAIRANRPSTYVSVNIQATHVTKAVTVQNRYGPGNGSSGQDQRSGELEY